MRRVVLYAATRNLYQDTLISLRSLMFHTLIDRAYILAEDDRLPYEMPDCVTVINVAEKGQEYFPKRGVNSRAYATYMDFTRIIMSRYLDEEIVLMMDSDTIVKKDLGDIFETDLSGKFFAAVVEPNKNWWAVPEYMNIGVTLMNLPELRTVDVLLQRLFNTVSGFVCPGQDLLNLVCMDRAVALPNKYNASLFTGKCRTEDVIVRHYAGHEKKNLPSDPDYGRFLNMSWNGVKML